MSDKTAESLANASLAAEVTAHKATKYYWKQTSILARELESEVTRLWTALDASNKILRCLNVVQADKDVKREVCEQVAANDATLAGKGEQ